MVLTPLLHLSPIWCLASTRMLGRGSHSNSKRTAAALAPGRFDRPHALLTVAEFPGKKLFLLSTSALLDNSDRVKQFKHCAKTRRSRGRSNLQNPVRWSKFPKSAACTIAMHGKQPEGASRDRGEQRNRTSVTGLLQLNGPELSQRSSVN